MDNSDKIILDLCGGTGSWSRYYKAAGYDVRVITLPEYDVLTYVPPGNVYGILAAPPLHRVLNPQQQAYPIFKAIYDLEVWKDGRCPV